MNRYKLILATLMACLVFVACDRGNQLFEQALEAEAQGDLEEARTHYLAIVRLLPDSDKSEPARASFVEISLDMAEQALEEDDVDRASHLLAQVEPLYEGPEGRRVNALAASIHEALESQPAGEEDVEAMGAVTDAVAP